jgi:Leucine-rich repeat (LRR) protein
MKIWWILLFLTGVAGSRPWSRSFCAEDSSGCCIFEGDYDGAPLTRRTETDIYGHRIPTACANFYGEINLANSGITELRPIVTFKNGMVGVYLERRDKYLELDDPGLAFESMRATSLILRSNRIDRLPRDTFEEFTTLKALDLSDNKIDNLPDEIFQSGRSIWLPLKSLSLSQNMIATLPQGIFRGLTSLTSLDLSQNRIGTLPEGILTGLAVLSYLRLYSNKIVVFPKGFFQGLSSLKRLDLEKNEIAALPERIFEGTPLSEVYLDFNKISTLPEAVFQGILSVQEPNSNKLKHSLTSLFLSNNQIVILPEGVFRGLSSLSELYLKNNNIEVLAERIFRGLSALTLLSLNDNRIAMLPWGIFEGLSSLVILHLHNNPGLECVPLTPQQRAKLVDYKGPETLCVPSTSTAEETTSLSPPAPVSSSGPSSSGVADAQKFGSTSEQTSGEYEVKMAVSLPISKDAFNGEPQVIESLVSHPSYINKLCLRYFCNFLYLTCKLAAF